MSGYEVLLINLRTGDPVQRWAALQGQPPLTASQATQVLQWIGDAAPEVHHGLMPGASPWVDADPVGLVLRPERVDPALVPATAPPTAPAGLGARIVRAVRNRRYSLVERHVVTHRVVRRLDVDAHGRPLLRWAAALQREREVQARPQSEHPWTYLGVEPTGAMA